MFVSMNIYLLLIAVIYSLWLYSHYNYFSFKKNHIISLICIAIPIVFISISFLIVYVWLLLYCFFVFAFAKCMSWASSVCQSVSQLPVNRHTFKPITLTVIHLVSPFRSVCLWLIIIWKRIDTSHRKCTTTPSIFIFYLNVFVCIFLLCFFSALNVRKHMYVDTNIRWIRTICLQTKTFVKRN